MSVGSEIQGFSRTALKKKPARSVSPMCVLDLSGFTTVMAIVVFVTMVNLMILRSGGHHGAGVDLARSHFSVSRPRASREDAIIIAITRDGKVFVGSNQLFLPALPGIIHNHLADGGERKVYFKVDAHARYGLVPPVLAKIRAAGVENICFLVEPRPSPPTVNAANQTSVGYPR